MNVMNNLTSEYLDDVLIRLAHHSSAIEGNTISLADTVSIILHHTIPGTPSKREFFEVENHRQTFEYVLECVRKCDLLTATLVNHIHRLLMDRLTFDAGKFKQHENAILGTDLITAPASQTPMLMQQWMENTEYRLEKASGDDEKIAIITASHIEFEKIHPYSDGNGRTGRMLMNFLLLREGIAPLIIKGADREIYIRLLAESDEDAFATWSSTLINEENERLQKFLNKEKLQMNI